MKTKLFLLPIWILILTACTPTAVASRFFENQTNFQALQIPVTSSKPFIGCGGPVIPVTNAAFEEAIIEQTNTIRMVHGLPPLKHITALDNSARYHAADMNSNNYFDHNSFDRINEHLTETCDPWNRIQAYYTNWQALAENIAAGQRSPDMAMNGWMNSPDHRENILSPNYTEIGAGFYEGSGEYRYYWDQNFGSREGIFPLVINGEQVQTKFNQSVPIYLYGDFTQVQFQVDGGAWSQWLRFQNNMSWDFPATPGSHRLTAHMVGRDGDVYSSDDMNFVP